jgi:hypothetical protein
MLSQMESPMDVEEQTPQEDDIQWLMGQYVPINSAHSPSSTSHDAPMQSPGISSISCR